MFRRGLVTSFPRINTRVSFGQLRRLTDSAQNSAETREGCVFVDSVFPIQMGRLDIRRYIGHHHQETVLTQIKERFENIKTPSLKVTSIEPHPKDGGVFVQFKYTTSDPEEVAFKSIKESIAEQSKDVGDLPSWTGTNKPNVWQVRGAPWKEDLVGRFASPFLKVSFEGPDVHEEKLYEIFRPYGRIEELTPPTPGAAGLQRFSMVEFERRRSAAIARNVVYGLQVPNTDKVTRLRISYSPPLEAHVIRDWIANHPKIVLPVLFFLVGTLTYIIFDPIRVVFVEAKMLNWFELKEFKLYKWLRANTLERLYSKSEHPVDAQIWKEREDAESAIRAYLSDLPSTVTFVHGPQGSGKGTMIASVLEGAERNSLDIDCRELSKASSDAQLVAGLAKQTGYWPVFAFLNNINNLIDLASVGLIGQKAGLSRSVDEQLQEILDIVAVGLRNVGNRQHDDVKKRIQKDKEHEKPPQEAKEPEKVDDKDSEASSQEDSVSTIDSMKNKLRSLAHLDEGKEKDRGGEAETVKKPENNNRSENTRPENGPDLQAVEALPIVVIRNFAGKTGSNREDLLNALAQWAAKLAENQIAHVIVVSDNRENSKRVAKALQSKPLNFVALFDADSDSALAFVQEKLHEAHLNVSLTREETQYVERLGGRSVDLESLVNKVRSGMGVKEAVEDIISRGVGELRKNAFGDDSEDAKNLPWTRDQAWTILNLLSKTAEVPYHQVLLDYPFKGDEQPMRSMEHAELISIATQDGRPSVIKPGKPVYRWVYERLVNDPIFRATQEIEFNSRLISSAEATVQSCEEELLKLTEIRRGASSNWLGDDPSSKRAQYLSRKMMDAERKLESLEKENAELKKTLAKLS